MRDTRDGQYGITSLMAAMATDRVAVMGKRCLLVLDAYFAVGPVFIVLKTVVDHNGRQLVHIVTRAKNNVGGHEDPPAKSGKRGRPRKYGLNLMTLFGTRAATIEQTVI